MNLIEKLKFPFVFSFEKGINVFYTFTIIYLCFDNLKIIDNALLLSVVMLLIIDLGLKITFVRYRFTVKRLKSSLLRINKYLIIFSILLLGFWFIPSMVEIVLIFLFSISKGWLTNVSSTLFLVSHNKKTNYSFLIFYVIALVISILFFYNLEIQKGILFSTLVFLICAPLMIGLEKENLNKCSYIPVKFTLLKSYKFIINSFFVLFFFQGIRFFMENNESLEVFVVGQRVAAILPLAMNFLVTKSFIKIYSRRRIENDSILNRFFICFFIGVIYLSIIYFSLYAFDYNERIVFLISMLPGFFLSLSAYLEFIINLRDSNQNIFLSSLCSGICSCFIFYIFQLPLVYMPLIFSFLYFILNLIISINLYENNFRLKLG